MLCSEPKAVQRANSMASVWDHSICIRRMGEVEFLKLKYDHFRNPFRSILCKYENSDLLFSAESLKNHEKQHRSKPQVGGWAV